MFGMKRRRTAKRIRRALTLRQRIRAYRPRTQRTQDFTKGMAVYQGKRTGKIWIEFTEAPSHSAIVRALNKH